MKILSSAVAHKAYTCAVATKQIPQGTVEKTVCKSDKKIGVTAKWDSAPGTGLPYML